MDKHKSTIYLDMDDVVADWMTAAQEYLQMSWVRGGPLIPVEKWQQLIHHGRFYKDLPIMPGAHELVQWAREFAHKNDMNLAFLTAIPSGNEVPFVFEDKITWRNKHFPDLPVFFGPYSTDKHKHCRRGDILIDDRPENCRQWREAGGIAHQYMCWEWCQDWIQSELPELMSRVRSIYVGS